MFSNTGFSVILTDPLEGPQAHFPEARVFSIQDGVLTLQGIGPNQERTFQGLFAAGRWSRIEPIKDAPQEAPATTTKPARKTPKGSS